MLPESPLDMLCDDDHFPGGGSAFWTVSGAARFAGCTPEEVRQSMAASGVGFAISINDVGLLNGNGLAAVLAHRRAASRPPAEVMAWEDDGGRPVVDDIEALAGRP